MKYLLFFFVCLITNTLIAQCTFEQFWDYYTYPVGTKARVLPLKDKGYLVYCNAEYDSTTVGNTQTHLIQFKTDACGIKIWTNDSGYAGDGDPDMEAIEMDSGNYMIVGYTAAGLPGSMGNIRVGKYNKNGKLINAKLLIGNPISAPYGVVKNSLKSNSYLIYGFSQNISTDIIQKPLLIEINSELSTIRSKQFGIKEDIEHLLIKDSNTFIALRWTETATTLLHLDSSFTIQKSYGLNRDSILDVALYQNQLYWSKDSSSLVGCGQVKTDVSGFSYLCLMRFDLQGNMQKITYLSGLGSTDFMSKTKDGGYILGAGQTILKVDSNFNTQWSKIMRGRLFSGFQLEDGGYIASGISNIKIYGPDGLPYFRPYLVRMDSVGNHIKTGTKEEEYNELSHAVSIYPNPAHSQFTIQTSLPYQTIQLYTITGNSVFQLSGASSNESINISGIARGLYILQLKDEAGVILHTQKLSVQY